MFNTCASWSSQLLLPNFLVNVASDDEIFRISQQEGIKVNREQLNKETKHLTQYVVKTHYLEEKIGNIYKKMTKLYDNGSVPTNFGKNVIHFFHYFFLMSVFLFHWTVYSLYTRLCLFVIIFTRLANMGIITIQHFVPLCTDTGYI